LSFSDRYCFYSAVDSGDWNQTKNFVTINRPQRKQCIQKILSSASTATTVILKVMTSLPTVNTIIQKVLGFIPTVNTIILMVLGTVPNVSKVSILKIKIKSTSMFKEPNPYFTHINHPSGSGRCSTSYWCEHQLMSQSFEDRTVC
jgi:hypothetical protein